MSKIKQIRRKLEEIANPINDRTVIRRIGLLENSHKALVNPEVGKF